MAAIAALAIALPACVQCKDPGCGELEGLQLVLATADERPLPTGTYEITVADEGFAWVFQCVVVGADEVSSCSGPTAVDPERNASAFIELGFPPADAPVPPSTITIVIAIHEEDGIASKHFGPEAVDVLVVRDGAPALEEHVEPDYERDYHRGDEACGFCEGTEVVLSLPPA